MFEKDALLDGRYRLTSRTADRDLGVVYHAHDLQNDRPVDILVLPLPEGARGDLQEQVRRIQGAVVGLERRDLIPYEEIGLIEDQLFLVRRRAGGESLADLLENSHRLPLLAALQITEGLCNALATVHRAGLVHGGLSPHCIFVSEAPDGSWGVEVSNVALLPVLRAFLAPSGQPWGRRPYLSPEQAAGEDVVPASDVYVIGSLLYAMLAGRPPFQAGDWTVLILQHLRQEPPSLQILVPEMPAPLAEIVQKTLSKEPSARYRNSGQLAYILRDQVGEHLSPRAARPPAVVPSPVPAARLLVPSPPIQSVRRAYEFVEDQEWEDEPEGIDWFMVGLLILAAIAVLGLIPLWHAVRERYMVPPLLLYGLPGVPAGLDKEGMALAHWAVTRGARPLASSARPDISLVCAAPGALRCSRGLSARSLILVFGESGKWTESSQSWSVLAFSGIIRGW